MSSRAEDLAIASGTSAGHLMATLRAVQWHSAYGTTLLGSLSSMGPSRSARLATRKLEEDRLRAVSAWKIAIETAPHPSGEPSNVVTFTDHQGTCVENEASSSQQSVDMSAVASSADERAAGIHCEGSAHGSSRRVNPKERDVLSIRNAAINLPPASEMRRLCQLGARCSSALGRPH